MCLKTLSCSNTWANTKPRRAHTLGQTIVQLVLRGVETASRYSCAFYSRQWISPCVIAGEPFYSRTLLPTPKMRGLIAAAAVVGPAGSINLGRLRLRSVVKNYTIRRYKTPYNPNPNPNPNPPSIRLPTYNKQSAVSSTGFYLPYLHLHPGRDESRMASHPRKPTEAPPASRGAPV